MDWSSLLVKTRFLSEYVEEGPEPLRKLLILFYTYRVYKEWPVRHIYRARHRAFHRQASDGSCLAYFTK